MKKFTLGSFIITPLLAAGLCLSAHAADTSMDKTFVTKAAVGGMFEVESSKIATDKGTTQGVKDFGSKMVEDHSKANDELKSIASSKGIDVPAALDSKHQKMLDSLNAKSGKAFDMEYLSDMSKSHKAADALFMKEADKGKDADLKAFADKTDKVIKEHISMLKDVQGNMKM